MNLPTILAKVDTIRPLTDSIIQLILSPDQYIDYKAGQYVQILSGSEFLSYSIANAPLGSHKYEFHIRHSGNPYEQPLFKQIKSKGLVQLRLPLGNCHLENLNPQAPIIFIAAGTGFAPVKSMIEQLLATGDPRTFELYWGARSQSDLYMDEIVKKWESHVKHFYYSSAISKTNFPDLIINRHQSQIADFQIIISGPFDMVYTVRDSLLSRGILQSHLFSDAFDFE
jgi:CDP-4-dehydro-6-deoxyglucose reductase